MKRFCIQCGKEAADNHKVCIHCGAELPAVKQSADKQKEQEPKGQPKQQPTAPKKPMSKKNKIIIAAVAAVVILLFGSHSWASSHYSAESVEKRFHQALEEGDAKKIKKLATREDGSSIETEEAEALVQLVEDGGRSAADYLYSVPFDKKILGLVDSFRIELMDQYAVYDENIEDLTFTFNGLTFDEYEKSESHVVYGPIAPGVYDVEATYDGNYGEASVEDSVRLSDDYGDYTYLDMDIPITYVNFSIENVAQLDLSKTKLLLGDEEFSISDDGYVEQVGPMIVDGSQSVKTVTEMAWGEVTSEEIAVDESTMDIFVSVLNKDQYEKLTETIQDFGEQYLEARAEKSTKPLKVASSSYEKELKKEFSDNYHFGAMLDTIEIDKNSIAVPEDTDVGEIKINVKYHTEEDERYKSKDLDLSPNQRFYTLTMAYEDESWIVSDVNNAGLVMNFEATDELKGKQEVYGPGKAKKKDDKDSKDESDGDFSESEAESFMIEYTEASVDAINDRDFSIVSPYITEDGPRRKEADEYIDYLDSKDIYEEFYGSELEKLEKVDDKTYKATTIEEFEIIRPDSSDTKKFRTVVELKVVDGELLVHKLISTDEI